MAVDEVASDGAAVGLEIRGAGTYYGSAVHLCLWDSAGEDVSAVDLGIDEGRSSMEVVLVDRASAVLCQSRWVEVVDVRLEMQTMEQPRVRKTDRTQVDVAAAPLASLRRLKHDDV